MEDKTKLEVELEKIVKIEDSWKVLTSYEPTRYYLFRKDHCVSEKQIKWEKSPHYVYSVGENPLKICYHGYSLKELLETIKKELKEK